MEQDQSKTETLAAVRSSDLLGIRELFAIFATEKDVDAILSENLSAYSCGQKIHNRQTARWEHAARVVAAMPNDKLSHRAGNQP